MDKNTFGVEGKFRYAGFFQECVCIFNKPSLWGVETLIYQVSEWSRILVCDVLRLQHQKNYFNCKVCHIRSFFPQ